MRVLTVSSLYPNSAQPTHGVFVENRMRHVQAAGLELRVVAPAPWFPSSAQAFGRYGVYGRIPDRETRHGITVEHPRYWMAPGLAYSLQPQFYYRTLLRRAQRLIREEGPFDLIDAHYFYPDGVAAAWLADALDLPLTITARGSDINQIPADSPRAKARILAAAGRANRIITVCEALRSALIDLGISPHKIVTLRNGVDLAAFSPLGEQTRASERARLGASDTAPLLISVGGLIPRKGHELTIDAVAALPGARLMIAGKGPLKGALEKRIRRLGAESRITLLGAVPHEELRALYGAADMSVLASSREGWANVLLESMACGTPVVATDVWGAPEVVTDPVAGRLVKKRDAAEIAAAIALTLASPPDRAAVRAYAEQFGWESTARGVVETFQAARRDHAGAAASTEPAPVSSLAS